jgi:hypothetical protein
MARHSRSYQKGSSTSWRRMPSDSRCWLVSLTMVAAMWQPQVDATKRVRATRKRVLVLGGDGSAGNA